MNADKAPTSVNTIKHRKFKLPNTEWVPDGGAFYIEGCSPVYRSPGGDWTSREGSRLETLWFIPEISGNSSVDPNTINFNQWVRAEFDAQAGRWVYVPATTVVNTPVHHDGHYRTRETCRKAKRGEVFFELPIAPSTASNDPIHVQARRKHTVNDGPNSRNDDVLIVLSDDVNFEGVQKYAMDRITYARLLLLDEDHHYAYPNTAKNPNAAEGFLISAPYGPFKVINRQPMDGSFSLPEGEQRYCHAVVKYQPTERQKSLYRSDGALFKALGEDPITATDSRLSLAEIIGFPEIAVNVNGAFTRKHLAGEGAPAPVYVVDLEGELELFATGQIGDDFEIETTNGNFVTFYTAQPEKVMLEITKTKTDGTEEVDSQDFYTKGHFGTNPTPSRFVSVRKRFVWFPEETKIDINLNFTELSNRFNGTFFGNHFFTVSISRLGDQNASTSAAWNFFDFDGFEITAELPDDIVDPTEDCPTITYNGAFLSNGEEIQLNLTIEDAIDFAPEISPTGDYDRFSLVAVSGANGFPPGLVLDDETGHISGTPTVVSSGQFTVIAHHAIHNGVATVIVNWAIS